MSRGHFFAGAFPQLPPMRYALFLPHRGAYLRQMDASARRYRFTGERASACVLPEPDARKVGAQLAQAAGEPVELRPWEDAGKGLAA